MTYVQIDIKDSDLVNLKDSSDIVASPLTKIINTSLTQGIVLSD